MLLLLGRPPQEGVCSGPRLSLHARALICGREIRIQVVESPGRHQLIPAIMVILLFDLAQKVGVAAPGCTWVVMVGGAHLSSCRCGLATSGLSGVALI